MQRIAIAKITPDECEEYRLIFEEQAAFRSLKWIIKQNPDIMGLAGLTLDDNLLNVIDSDAKECNRKINLWWDKMDKKYILEYDERRVLVLDFEERTIYSIDKRDWYRGDY